MSIKKTSIVNQLLKDFNRVNNSAAAEARTNSFLQANAETFVTGEDIALGDPVILRGDGKIDSAFNKVPQSGVPISLSLTAYSPVKDKILIVNSTQSATGRVNGNVIDWNSASTHSSFTFDTSWPTMEYVLEKDKFVILDDNDIILGYVTSGGTNATFSERIPYFAGSILGAVMTYSTSLSRLIIVYSRVADLDVNNNLYLVLGDIDQVNNSISFAAPILIQDTIGGDFGYVNAERGYWIFAMQYLEQRGALMICGGVTGAFHPMLLVGTIDVVNNRVTFGETTPLYRPIIRISMDDNLTSVYDSVNDRMVVLFSNYWDSVGIAFILEPTSNNAGAKIGAPIYYDTSTYGARAIFDSNSEKVIISYQNIYSEKMKLVALNIDPILNVLSLDDVFVITDQNSSNVAYLTYANSKLVYLYETKYRLIQITTPILRNQFQFIGFSNESSNQGEKCVVTMFGLNDKQSGLEAGTNYYVGESTLSTTVSSISVGRTISDSIIQIN